MPLPLPLSPAPVISCSGAARWYRAVQRAALASYVLVHFSPWRATPRGAPFFLLEGASRLISLLSTAFLNTPCHSWLSHVLHSLVPAVRGSSPGLVRRPSILMINFPFCLG